MDPRDQGGYEYPAERKQAAAGARCRGSQRCGRVWVRRARGTLGYAARLRYRSGGGSGQF
eukprot:6006689-Prymnesium_polylepis.1